MEVNNDAIIYGDNEQADDGNVEDEQITYEDFLADDLCTATMMLKSIMDNYIRSGSVWKRMC